MPHLSPEDVKSPKEFYDFASDLLREYISMEMMANHTWSDAHHEIDAVLKDIFEKFVKGGFVLENGDLKDLSEIKAYLDEIDYQNHSSEFRAFFNSLREALRLKPEAELKPEERIKWAEPKIK